MDISEKIRSYRIARNLTQSKLAEKAGIAKSTLVKYELGEMKPKQEMIRKLASALDISISVLLDIPMETVSDYLSVIFKMCDQTGIIFHADKDSYGNYEPATISISFENEVINQRLSKYMSVIDARSDLLAESLDCSTEDVERRLDEVNQNIKAMEIQLLDENTQLRDEAPHMAETDYNNRVQRKAGVAGVANVELNRLLLDCKPDELDTLVEVIRFTKQMMRKKREQ